MTISAKVIASSVNAAGKVLTTMQLRYPRFIHAEELTHRVLCTQPEIIEIIEVVELDGLMYDRDLSRNASSSRAVPFDRLVQDLVRDPVTPVYWGANRPGMQAREELTGRELRDAKYHWGMAINSAILHARAMHSVGLHKQIVNRVLEPYTHINVIVTATEWENFYALRRHPDAQPEMQALADAMWLAQQASIPKLLAPGQWHLPYVDQEGDEADKLFIHLTGNSNTFGPMDLERLLEAMIKISVARCARVSYLTHDGRHSTIEEDLALYDLLLAGGHMSPFEHQATPDQRQVMNTWETPELHGNLVGWRQHRKLIPGENRKS